MEYYIDKCKDEYQKSFSNNKENKKENNSSEDIEFEENLNNYSYFFFINLNEAIFSGEYLEKKYINNIDNFISILPTSEEKSEFSLCIRATLDQYKLIISLINNRLSLQEDLLLFSAIKNKKYEYRNDLIIDINLFSLSLMKNDHLLAKNDDLGQELILMKNELELKQIVDDENIKNIYNRLYSKCLFLIKKIYFEYEKNDSRRFSIDFQESDLDKISESNSENNFTKIVNCLNKRDDKEFEKIYTSYIEKFSQNNYSTLGFIIITQYYRLNTKDQEQLKNLKQQFDDFERSKTKNDISAFDKYALNSIKNYIFDCLFAIKVEDKKYDYKDLKEDLKNIHKIQQDTKINNYHPYYKALQWFSEKVKNDAFGDDDDDSSQDKDKTYKELINLYEKSLGWCDHRRFYPIQLLKEECITNNKIFIASSVSLPINLKKGKSCLEEFKETYRINGRQKDFHKFEKKISDSENRLKEFRRESYQYLGIFIAIITFLFGSIQLFIQKDIPIKDLFKNIISIGLVLCIFEAILSIIMNNSKYKNVILIGVIILCIGLLLLLTYT